MKGSKVLIGFMVIILSIILSGRVLATELPLQITANETTSGDGTIIIKVSNDEAVGVIKGKISFNSNFESIEVSSSYNGWTTTYNEETGSFNSFYAKGVTSGDVIEIKYKLKSDASSGTITLSEIALTTIEYNTLTIENEINQEVKKIDNTDPHGDPDKEPETDPKEDQNKDSESQNDPEKEQEGTPKGDTEKEDTKQETNTQNNQEQKDTKIVNITNTSKDKTITTNKLPKTGKTAILFLSIIAIVTAFITAIKSFKYRGIK